MLATCSPLIPNTITAGINEVQRDQTFHFLQCCIVSNKRLKENKIKSSGRKQRFFGFILQNYCLSRFWFSPICSSLINNYSHFFLWSSDIIVVVLIICFTWIIHCIHLKIEHLIIFIKPTLTKSREQLSEQQKKSSSFSQKCVFCLNSLVSNKAQILIQVSPLFYGVCHGFSLYFFPDALVPNLLHSRLICNLLSFMYILVILARLNLFEIDNLSVKRIKSSLKPLRITEVEHRNRRGTSLTPFWYQNENHQAKF